MMETLVGDNGSRFIIAAGAVAIGLLCLVAVLWIIRRRPSSPFVRGGRNRQPRLAVLDAAAVDTRRRLVLVRRDDVEHLIMIGGPTDIVIESRIVADAAEAPGGTRPAEPQRNAEPEPTIEAPVARRPEAKPQSVAMEKVVAGSVTPTRAEPARPAPEPEPAPAPELAAVPRSAPARQPSHEPTFTTPQATPAVAVPSMAELRRQMSMAPRDGMAPIARQAEGERPAQVGPTEPRQTAQPQLVQVAPAEKSADFERMLDAEISSDLQRLAPTVTPRPQVRPAANVRQEPALGSAPADARKEPSIEEEMTRMLADISAGRKP